MKRHERCSISGSRANLGAAPVKYHYFYRFFTYSVERRLGPLCRSLVSGVKRPAAADADGLCVCACVRVATAVQLVAGWPDPSEDGVRRGSLTGAVHLSNGNRRVS